MARKVKVKLECKGQGAKRSCCVVTPKSFKVRGLQILHFVKDGGNWKAEDTLTVTAVGKTPFHRRSYGPDKELKIRVQKTRLDGEYEIEVHSSRERKCGRTEGPRMIIKKDG